jgi:hypothetical protein
MLLDRKWGGGWGGGESLKKAEQDWPLQQLCTPRPLSRRHDPEPLGGAVAGRTLRTSQRQARRCVGYIQCCWTKSGNLAVATALVAGRSFQDRIDQLVQLLCAAIHALARMSCQQSEQLTTTPAKLGAYNHLKLTHNTFLPRILLAWREFIATGPRPCFGGHVPPA